MTPIIENSVLGTHLDFQNNDLKNVGQMFPVPAGLVGSDDPALGDPRAPAIGSVTDFHVNAVAAIAQDKLLFNGAPPPGWIGSSDNQMAAGNLVERAASKGVTNGYAALDAGGKLPASHVSAGAGVGTVSAVALQMPPELLVAGSPVIDHGSFAASWKDAPDGTWFGVHGIEAGAALRPSFVVEPMPPALIPSLDATKFASGVFSPKVLPVAAGLGTGSSTGVVPDPGVIGLPTDYLGRDMEWHTTAPEVTGMPTAPRPWIAIDSWSDSEVIVTVRSSLPDSSLFTLVQKYPDYVSPGFSLAKLKDPLDDDVHITLTVHDKDIVWAYAAKDGYNNSTFITAGPGAGRVNPLVIVTPLTEPPLPLP